MTSGEEEKQQCIMADHDNQINTYQTTLPQQHVTEIPGPGLDINVGTAATLQGGWPNSAHANMNVEIPQEINTLSVQEYERGSVNALTRVMQRIFYCLTVVGLSRAAQKPTRASLSLGGQR